MPDYACLICHGPTHPAGRPRGRRTGREFVLQRCGSCGFVFVAEPWTDYAQIYDVAYYVGRGSDPSVDYAYEFENPQRTVRRYEWRGLVRSIASLQPAPAKWLDYGCGTGGLVRYARENSRYDMYGFDTGAWAERARASGLPIFSPAELPLHEGTFDIVTAIEVIEHCVDPLNELRRLRRLLKPGGLLFLTTGNADSAPADFAAWKYVNPEIHVSYFTSRALRLALEQTGFAPFDRGAIPGTNDILRFKILKSFRTRNVNLLERLLPWPILTRVADRLVRFSATPLARAC
ncbi:MAG TPA: class I SAM-dependent methyltransferase [Opitutus sp.]|nr:class I SAM-dependent methyltransferase [Opitutus sp.]